LLLLLAATANAEWQEASGDHFVIYSDQSEAAVRSFAERLERYHAAMAHVYALTPGKPSPSNRVTVFVISSPGKLHEILTVNDQHLRHGYIARAGASIAVIPAQKGGSTYRITQEQALFHAYAHHFMIANLTARAYPVWFNEGFAEFFASARFRAGGVELGAADNALVPQLVVHPSVPLRTLLSSDGGRKGATSHDAFYGQSWLLFHYLQMAPERAYQLASYQRLLAAGQAPLQAAEGAFGNLEQLEKDLDAYKRRRLIASLFVRGQELEVGSIVVRKLGPGEAAMMPTLVQSKAGVDRDEATALLPEARRVAALYPNDAAVLSALAEAEFDAGNDDAAIAAADRALAFDANRINAHLQKGYALARKVESGVLPKEAWRDVRIQFVKANAVENDNPIPLLRFYLTYLKQGEPPTKNAIAGLERSLQLAPFDGALRWVVAQQMIADERFEDAAQTLRPLAYSPHPSERAEAALKLLEEVEVKASKARPDPPLPGGATP
jgi:tetratricopeptide (TPR) repeat protein